MSLIDDLLKPEPKVPPKNWFSALPEATRIEMCKGRAALKASGVKLKNRTIMERFAAHLEGIPDDPKRISEFMQNDGGAFPDPSESKNEPKAKATRKPSR